MPILDEETETQSEQQFPQEGTDIKERGGQSNDLNPVWSGSRFAIGCMVLYTGSST